MLCVLSLKLLRLWLAAVVLLEGWSMFSALRAGSGAGDVGPGSSPISHLSETMRALLDTSPVEAAQAAYFPHSEGGAGAGWGGTFWGPRRSQGETGKGWGHCLPCPSPLLPSPPCPPPFFVNSLFLEIKKQTNNTNSSSLMKETFLLQNKELRAIGE